MSDTKFVAHCADCGHAYKVPSETKVYPCKKCGGEVCAQAEETEPEEELEVLPEHKSIRQRHPREKASKSPMILGGTVLALVAIGALGYAQGWFGFLTGAEPDFEKVSSNFVEDWNGSELLALEASYHPSKQEEFHETLISISQGRGWSTSFPSITSENHKIVEGSEGTPEKATIDFQFVGLGLGAEDVEGSGSVAWQFEPSRDRWYIYDLKLTPSPLEPRASGFREAWAKSDVNALRPYFRDSSETQMVDLVSKFSGLGDWQAEFPAITGAASSGEELARSPTAFLLGAGGGEVLTEYTTAGKPLTVKWSFSRTTDTWNVTGFKSFP